MSFQKHTLPNGLQILGEVAPSALSMAIGFFVRTGSRDETPDVSGVTHFLEHMIFKGTPRRTALDVNLEFDRIGASYNAYTSEETTVFYAAILPEYMERAVDLLADILRPSLREEDFEMEKEVIIEEIGMYDDIPMYSAYDQAKQLYFTGHPLGNSILGTPESIRALKRDQMAKYFEQRYVPGNITVAVAGNFIWDDFVQLIEKHCGHWPKDPGGRTGISDTKGAQKFVVKQKESVHQEHMFLISPAPSITSPLVYAADILSMIFGDDSGSRLYWNLVDPGLVDTAEASIHEHEGTGAFFTMISCDPESAKANLDRVNELMKDMQEGGVSEEELAQAKNKIMSRLVRSSERPMGRMKALGNTWTYLKTYRSIDEELALYDQVTTADIRKVLDDYPLTLTTTFAFGPLAEL